MADIESNIDININTAGALQSIKALQREISAFHSSMATNGAAANVQASQMQSRLVNNINATGKFSAQMKAIASTTDTFNTSLEKNKLSMGEYFRYAGASTKTFGSQFKSEFATINKVARESVKDLQTQYIKLGRDASGSMQSIAVRPMSLDMKDFATQTALASAKSQIFNKLVDQGSTNLLNWGKNTQWAGRQLMVGFTLPLGIFATVAAKSFMDIEKSLVQFRRVYGDAMTPDAEISGMTDQIKEVASAYTQYGVAVSDTIDLAARAAAMGNTGDALVGAVSQTAKLAVLGGIDQQKSLETVTSLTNTFGIATKDLAMNIDLLNAVENQTVLSIDDLTTAIPIAAPVIAALGGDVGDLTVMLVAMKEGGINASQGANALKSGLASLINPASSAVTFLGDLGVNITALRDANKGNAAGMISGLARELDKLDPLNRAQAIEQLFGKFQFARMSTLLANINKEGGQAARALALTTASAGELAAISSKELSAISDSPAFKFDKMVEDLKMSMAPIGEAFLKLAIPIMEAGVKILGFFDSMSDSAKQWTIGIIAFFGAIVPVAIMGLGLLANGFANLIKGVLWIGRTFLGVGKKSRYLGDETKYMSQAQRDAAAVASSLDQVHSQLIQRFTSEREAVDKLTEAYRRSILEQGGMRGAPMQSSMPGAVNVATGTRAPAAETLNYSYKPKGEEDSTVEKHLAQQIGQKNADLQLARVNAARAAELKYVRENGGSASQLKSANQIDRSHVIPIRQQSDKANDEAWMSGAWTADTHTQNNMILNTLKTSSQKGTNTHKTYMEYLKKVGASAKQISAMNDKITQGIAFSESELAVSGKALGLIATDVKSGIIKSGKRSRVDNVSEQFPLWAGAASAGQTARNKVVEEQGPTKVRQSSPSAKGIEEARLRLESVTNKNVAAVEEGTATQKLTTAQKKIQAQSTRTSSAAEVLNTQQMEQFLLLNGTEQRATISAIKRRNKAIDDGTLTENTLTAAQKTAIAKLETSNMNSGGGPAAPLPPGSRLKMGLGKASAIGMGAMALGGAASMIPGGVGESVGAVMPVIMSMSMLLPVLQMLPVSMLAMLGPIALVVVALGALAAIGLSLKASFDNAQRAAEDFAYKTSGSNQAIEAIAEISGNATASQTMDQRRKEASSATYAPTENQAEIVKAFSESDSGKATITALGESLAKGNSAQALSSISNQMATAISQGAITRIDADQIMADIGTRLGDTTFSLKASAALDSIMLPNGTDLTKNPLEIKLRILGNTQESITSAADSMPNFGDVSKSTNIVVSSLISGVPVIGAWTAGVMGLMNYFQDLGTASGVMASNLVISSQQSQGMLDSLQVEYETKLQIAIAAEDTAKAEKLTTEYQKDRLSIIGKNVEIMKASSEAYGKMTDPKKTAIIGSLDQQIKDMYSEGPQKDIANKAISNIGDQTADGSTAELTLKTVIASGDMDPQTMNAVLDLLKAKEQDVSIITSLIENYGPEEANRVMAFSSLAKDQDASIEFMTSFKDKNPEETAKILSTLDVVRTVGGAEATEVAINLVTSNPEKFTALQNDLSILETEAAKGPIVLTSILEQLSFIDQAGIQAMSANQAWFDSIPDSQKKDYISRYITVYATATDTEASQWAKNSGMSIRQMEKMGISGIKSAYAANQAKEYVSNFSTPQRDAPEQPGPTSADTPSGGSGGGSSEPAKAPTSFLDDLVKKLRDVRTGALNLTENFADSFAAINGMFGGNSSVNVFSGLQQQLRGLGAGEDLISMITGMSAEDYAKYKDQMFNFDAAGNVTGFKDMVVSIGDALRAVTLGDFQNKQSATIKSTLDQVNAVKKLVASGMSYADAYSIASDAAVAGAISNETNATTIKKVGAEALAAAEALKAYASASTLATQSADVEASKKAVAWLQQNAGALTDAQTAAILASQEMQNLIANLKPGFDATALQQALTDAENAAQLSLEVKKLTIDGMQEIFQDGLSKAMESFSAQETAIKIKFDIERKTLQDPLTEAQKKISDLQNAPGGLDDLQADVERIGEKEKDINDKYDDRFKALDKIQAANAKINAQQQSQLSIADALSKGDISAAAYAAQDIRSQMQTQAIEDQRTSMEAAKEAEIASLLGATGRTRVQLEDQIRALNVEIFDIQENIVEVKEYQIELLDRQQATEIAGLEVLGKTRTEWEAIQNNIELARTSSDSYNAAITEAENIVSAIVNYWDNLDGKEVTTIHTIIENTVRAPAPAAPAAPAPRAPAPAAPTGPVKDDAWLNDMARRVYRGEFGNGQARRNALGSDYDAIQRRVNTNYYAIGGMVASYMATGGYLAAGGAAASMKKGTDTVPAMLTPGEFVMKRGAVQKYGAGFMRSINDLTFSMPTLSDSKMYFDQDTNFGKISKLKPIEQKQTLAQSSVYNNEYSISVNVKSDSNPDQIAKTVIAQIKQIDSQKLRGNRF
jgi:TP901 family phage tail tape measure protein